MDIVDHKAIEDQQVVIQVLWDMLDRLVEMELKVLQMDTVDQQDIQDQLALKWDILDQLDMLDQPEQVMLDQLALK